MWPNSEPVKIIEGAGPELGLMSFPQFGNPTSGLYWRYYQLDDMISKNGDPLLITNNPEFFSIGKSWKIKTIFADPAKIAEYETYTVTEELAIGDKSVFVIDRIVESANASGRYYGYYENGIVYISAEKETDYRPIIDFGATLHQQLDVYDIVTNTVTENAMTVENIKYPIICGKKLIAFYVSTENDAVYQWISGIGAISLDGMLIRDTEKDGVASQIIYEVRDGGACIFNYDEYMNTGQINFVLKYKNASTQECIYNLDGQKIEAPVKGQIYIVNGKKIMVPAR